MAGGVGTDLDHHAVRPKIDYAAAGWQTMHLAPARFLPGPLQSTVFPHPRGQKGGHCPNDGTYQSDHRNWIHTDSSLPDLP
jgi:hypothetical protein